VEIAETVASRQEKLLVFTQFKEIIPPLERLLSGAFSRPGLVLHGETAVGKRKEIVKRFQEDEAVPFCILSLAKAGIGRKGPFGLRESLEAISTSPRSPAPRRSGASSRR
jgi:SNF2 family DNA or RNA helicase